MGLVLSIAALWRAVAGDPQIAGTSDRVGFSYVKSWVRRPPAGYTYRDVAVSRDGLFYAMKNRWEDTIGIDVYDDGGRLLKEIRHKENRFTSEWIGMTADRRGHFYFALAGFLFAFSENGDFVEEIVVVHPKRAVVEPVAAFTLDGERFYVSDTTRFIGEFSRDGYCSKFVKVPFKARSYVRGLAADRKRYVYATVGGPEALAIFDKELNLIRKIGRRGTANGEFRGIGRIAVNNRTVVVCDSWNRRLQLLDKNGCHLVAIPSRSATAVAIDDEDAIVTLEAGGLVCYKRIYRKDRTVKDEDFAEYLRALDLADRGESRAAAAAFQQMAKRPKLDPNLREVVQQLASKPSLCSRRHLEPKRPLAAAEVTRLLTDRASVLFVKQDPYDEGATWAACKDRFVMKCDQDENVEDFSIFPKLHGIKSLNVADLTFAKNRIWAATDHGLCFYTRARGIWQFYELREELRGTRIAALRINGEAIEVTTKGGAELVIKP